MLRNSSSGDTIESLNEFQIPEIAADVVLTLAIKITTILWKEFLMETFYLIKWHSRSNHMCCTWSYSIFLFSSSGSAFWKMTCPSGRSEHSTLSANNSWCTSCVSAALFHSSYIFWVYRQRKAPVIGAEMTARRRRHSIWYIALQQAMCWLPLLCSHLKYNKKTK